MIIRNKKTLSTIFASFFFFVFFASPSVALAKLDLIDVRTNPETPGPNQAVTVNVESYVFNLNAAEIVWYVDDVAVKHGTAEKSFITRTKNFGEAVKIDIVITTIDGARYDRSITIKPEEVDMLWEANTYTPPFYKGKALPTYKSTIKVIAIPRFGSLISAPQDFYYRWTVGRSVGAGEGLGKNSTIVQSGWSGSKLSVGVAVTKLNTEDKGSAFTQIPIVDPVVMLYEQAPLLGVLFEKSLSGSATTKGTDFKVRAVPYFFSMENYGTNDMLYTWTNGSTPVSPAEDPNTLTLLHAGDAEQSSLVRLTVQNRKRILQEASERVMVNFVGQ